MGATINVIRAPTGVWIFVGTGIPSALAYVHESGRPATDEELAKARRFGPRLAHVKTRAFETREEAVAAAAAHGLEVA